jgi:hypothetical protein
MGIGDGGENFVAHDQAPAGFLGGGFGFCDNCGDALADETERSVQDQCVVRIVGGDLVAAGGEVPGRGVLPREDAVDAGHDLCGLPVDGDDVGMGVGGAQQLHVEQAVDGLIQREACLAGDDCHGVRCGDVAAAGRAGLRDLGGLAAGDGVGDGAVAGAAAEIALQSDGQIVLLGLVQRGCGHHHAGGAKAALEGLGREEGLLHRVQGFCAGQAADRGDGSAFGTEGGEEATMHGLPIDMDGAGAAIAGVAAFFNAEMPHAAQERP